MTAPNNLPNINSLLTEGKKTKRPALPRPPLKPSTICGYRYNFSLSLVSLPGRAGLDLNITLSYNSLIWLKHAGRMEFDYDYYPTLTAGFRTGFPEIEPPYYINGYQTYIVYLPSGRRVEMRQVATNRFEAIDSSYLYLTVNATDPTKMTLFSTDGTQYKFEQPSQYSMSRCTRIKDRNGNYISIAYKDIGDPEWPLTVIDKVTDTLGREIFFNYDGNLHLLSITQNWNGQTFYWAHFDYGVKYVAPNFGSLQVYGPNNTNIPVITRVITGDGARHTFVYNSWGQAEDIWTYGEADNPRAAMDYVFPSTGSPQSDCPRFTQRNDYIAEWAGETGNGWASNYFYFEPNEAYGFVTGPDGVTYKEVFSAFSQDHRRVSKILRRASRPDGLRNHNRYGHPLKPTRRSSEERVVPDANSRRRIRASHAEGFQASRFHRSHGTEQ